MDILGSIIYWQIILAKHEASLAETPVQKFLTVNFKREKQNLRNLAARTNKIVS